MIKPNVCLTNSKFENHGVTITQINLSYCVRRDKLLYSKQFIMTTVPCEMLS